METSKETGVNLTINEPVSRPLFAVIY